MQRKKVISNSRKKSRLFIDLFQQPKLEKLKKKFLCFFQEFQKKEADVQEKLRIYEQEKMEKRAENDKKSTLKQTQIEKVLETNVQREEGKKEAYYNSVKETEKRKVELEARKEQEIEQKKQESMFKDQKRIQVNFFPINLYKSPINSH